jgi:hypothetical protein
MTLKEQNDELKHIMESLDKLNPKSKWEEINYIMDKAMIKMQAQLVAQIYRTSPVFERLRSHDKVEFSE